jgi:hypothetical protein
VAYLSTYRKSIALARASADDPPPADVPESLIAAVLATRPKSA